jgi:hypothetical protein
MLRELATTSDVGAVARVIRPLPVFSNKTAGGRSTVISHMWTPAVYQSFHLVSQTYAAATCWAAFAAMPQTLAKTNSLHLQADRLVSSCVIGACKTRFGIMFVEMQGTCPSIGLRRLDLRHSAAVLLLPAATSPSISECSRFLDLTRSDLFLTWLNCSPSRPVPTLVLPSGFLSHRILVSQRVLGIF